MIRTIIISTLCGTLAGVLCRHAGITGVDYWTCVIGVAALSAIIID